MIGSMLPDMIDKPIGEFIFFNTFNNGRIFAHTLLFIILLTILAVLAYKYWKTNSFGVLALATAFHIIQDGMMFKPRTFFWPLYGLDFPKYNFQDYIPFVINNWINNPKMIFNEILFILGLIAFIYYFGLYRTENLKNFIYKGKLQKTVGKFYNK